MKTNINRNSYARNVYKRSSLFNLLVAKTKKKQAKMLRYKPILKNKWYSKYREDKS